MMHPHVPAKSETQYCIASASEPKKAFSPAPLPPHRLFLSGGSKHMRALVGEVGDGGGDGARLGGNGGGDTGYIPGKNGGGGGGGGGGGDGGTGGAGGRAGGRGGDGAMEHPAGPPRTKYEMEPGA
jgi:hypothetical protein